MLPRDDDDIDLLGTGEGPYKLTLTTFDANGEPIDTAFEDTTESAKSTTTNSRAHRINLQVVRVARAMAVVPVVAVGASAGGGGGGSVGLFTLLALVLLLRRRN